MNFCLALNAEVCLSVGAYGNGVGMRILFGLPSSVGSYTGIFIIALWLGNLHGNFDGNLLRNFDGNNR